MRNTFINTIIDACTQREDIFIISGDAGLGVFDEFKERFPDKFLNLGVAEQNAASFAAGLALTGCKVYLYNIIPFILYRCYEQVRNDICYQELPIVLVGIGSGITYAPQGMTHYSIEDIGVAMTLPNLTVISPIDPIEAKLAAKYSLTATGPVYVRLAKRGEPIIHERDNFDITMPQIVKDGSKVAVLVHGSISTEVIEAYRQLSKDGMCFKVISIPMVQPLNKEVLIGMLKDVKAVVCVEEHYENCGLGSIIRNTYSEKRPTVELKTMGVPYGFIHEIKDNSGMRKHFGISSDAITRTVREFWEK